MRDWALVSSIVPGTRYFEEIWPTTEPLFRAYADKWEMDWLPHFPTPAELAEFDASPAPKGTGAVYAGIPHRLALLDTHKGVIFLDSDAVIMDYAYDICREVSENVPIAAGGNFNGAVVVMRSCDKTRRFLDQVWRDRGTYGKMQWLEQAAMMELVGYEGTYPGDDLPSKFIDRTYWTPFWCKLSGRWNAHPLHPQPVRPLIFHPGGVQPFDRRLKMVLDAAVGILPAPWDNNLPRT